MAIIEAFSGETLESLPTLKEQLEYVVQGDFWDNWYAGVDYLEENKLIDPMSGEGMEEFGEVIANKILDTAELLEGEFDDSPFLGIYNLYSYVRFKKGLMPDSSVDFIKEVQSERIYEHFKNGDSLESLQALLRAFGTYEYFDIESLTKAFEKNRGVKNEDKFIQEALENIEKIYSNPRRIFTEQSPLKAFIANKILKEGLNYSNIQRLIVEKEFIESTSERMINIIRREMDIGEHSQFKYQLTRAFYLEFLGCGLWTPTVRERVYCGLETLIDELFEVKYDSDPFLKVYFLVDILEQTSMMSPDMRQRMATYIEKIIGNSLESKEELIKNAQSYGLVL